MVRHRFLCFAAVAILGCTTSDASRDGGTTPTEGGTSGSSSGGWQDSGSKDASGGDAGSDGGHTPSSTYPAFPVDVAQVVDNGGPVLAAPAIVTVTWSSDPQAATWNAYDDAIGASTYWHAINGEYGVGTATSGGHVSITTPAPSSMSDQDLDALVSTNVGNGTWPASAANTIYAVYMPPNTDLVLGGAADAGGRDACATGTGAYHAETRTGSYVYAILPQCPGFLTSDIQVSAGHELNEAATDPHSRTNQAYKGFDPNHLAWELFEAFRDELGDACENFFPWAFYTDTETAFPYPVQRQWSNESARAGHNFCAPVPTDAFYNVTAFPSEQTTVDLDLSSLGMGAGMTQSRGYKGTLGQPLTFHLGAFSDAPTGGPWNLTANVDQQFQFLDQNGNAVDNGAATVSLDKTSVVNGDVVAVTVTPTSWGSLGCVYIWFQSLMGNTSGNNPPPHGEYPIIVSQN